VNAKLGLTPGKASHHLAQKFVESGVGFLKGQRCFLGNNLNVGCSYVAKWSQGTFGDEPLDQMGSSQRAIPLLLGGKEWL
jgi:hypothetical protein